MPPPHQIKHAVGFTPSSPHPFSPTHPAPQISPSQAPSSCWRWRPPLGRPPHAPHSPLPMGHTPLGPRSPHFAPLSPQQARCHQHLLPCSQVTRCAARSRSWAPSATRWCEHRAPPPASTEPPLVLAMPRWRSIKPNEEEEKEEEGAAPSVPAAGFIAAPGLRLHELLDEGSQLPPALGGAEGLGEVQKGPRGARRLLQHLGRDGGVATRLLGMGTGAEPGRAYPHLLEGPQRAQRQALGGALWRERNPRGSPPRPTCSPAGVGGRPPPGPDSPKPFSSARNCCSAPTQAASGAGERGQHQGGGENPDTPSSGAVQPWWAPAGAGAARVGAADLPQFPPKPSRAGVGIEEEGAMGVSWGGSYQAGASWAAPGTLLLACRSAERGSRGGRGRGGGRASLRALGAGESPK